MTDEQIIKALECCSGEADICKSTCPCYVANASCLKNMAKEALDLINRQKAEIKDLIEMTKEFKSFPCFTKDTQFVSVSRKADGQFTADKVIQIEVYKIRAEAIKEFAERVKVKTLAMIWSPEFFSTADYIECIDSLVKETVGEQ